MSAHDSLAAHKLTAWRCWIFGPGSALKFLYFIKISVWRLAVLSRNCALRSPVGEIAGAKVMAHDGRAPCLLALLTGQLALHLAEPTCELQTASQAWLDRYALSSLGYGQASFAMRLCTCIAASQHCA
eukprot:2012998-Amphidinium_carterae.1